MEEQKKFSILYVDDDPQNLRLFHTALQHKYRIFTVESGREALQVLSENTIHNLLADQRMPDINGIQLLEQVSRQHSNTIRILVTGYSDIDVVIQAINREAVYRYISKPWDIDQVAKTLENALELYGLREENQTLMRSLDQQNRLLCQKVEELKLLNELHLELKGLGSEQIVLQALKSLEEKLAARSSYYFGRITSYAEDLPEAGALLDLLNGLPEAQRDWTRTLPGAGGQPVVVLPLLFEDQQFGHYLFVFPPGVAPDPSELLFAEAASHVAACALYCDHVHAEDLKRERLFLLGQMAGMIAHDLKGPLSVILGFVELLREAGQEEEKAEFCSTINLEVQKLLEHIEELVSFSNGQTSLHLAPIELANFIHEVLELFRLGFDRENIRTELSLEDGQLVYGDRSKLRKAFIHLLDYARDALQLAPGERRIRIASQVQNQSVQITLANTGLPPAKEGLPKLFDPYSTKLGLAICKKIIEEHQGSLEVRSDPKAKGTEFLMTLPVKPTLDQAR